MFKNRSPRIALPVGFRYRVFLSYSSSDVELARWLQRRLEGYRTPSNLVGKQGRFGAIPDRIGRVFRDREEARADGDLESLIAGELARSQQLVVLCTPAAADAAAWVGREIEIFLRAPERKPIHAAIGGGVPPACFPKPLFADSASGPLAADLRLPRAGGKDGRERGLHKIIAAILGTEFDDLWKREQRRRRKQLVVGLIASIALALLFTVTIQRIQQGRAADQYMRVAQQAQIANQWDLAAYAAAGAAAHASNLPLVGQSQGFALLKELRGAARTTSLLLGNDKTVITAALDETRNLVFTGSLDGYVRMWTLAQPYATGGQRLHRFVGPVDTVQYAPTTQRLLAVARSGRVIVVETGQQAPRVIEGFNGEAKRASWIDSGRAVVIGTRLGQVVIWRPDASGQPEIIWSGGTSIEGLTVSADEQLIAFADETGQVAVYDLESRRSRIVAKASSTDPIERGLSSIDLSPTARHILVSRAQVAQLYDVSGSTSQVEFTWQDRGVEMSRIGPSGRVAASVLSGDALALWETTRGDLIRQLLVPGCTQVKQRADACTVSTIAFHPTNDVLFAGYWDGTVRVWNTTDSAPQAELRGHISRVAQLVVAHGGGRLLSTAEDRSVRLWTLEAVGSSAKLVGTFCGQTPRQLLRLDGIEQAFGLLTRRNVFEQDAAAITRFTDARHELPARGPCD